MRWSEALLASCSIGWDKYMNIIFLIVIFDLNFLLPETFSYQFLPTYILYIFLMFFEPF